MNNRLFETLEFCLRDIEQGADVGVNLARHPDLAGELRPILEASVKAKAMAVPAPSGEVFRRNRAKLLQHAAEMRERKVAPPSRRIWSVPLRRALVMLAVVVLLFVSGTGLVRASSTSLPGDNLYPVKRIWERMSLWFTFDTAIREKLEYEHENERLEELSELLALGRSAKVDFAGYVTRQSLDEWRVSGITVFISFDTRLPNEQVVTGAAVRVRGQTVDGGVAAERVELLPPDSRLPEVEKDEYEAGQEEGANPQNGGGSGGSSGSGSSAPSHTPSSTPEPEKVSIEGTVTSIQNNLIVVNGIVMDIRSAEINGAPSLGALAKVEGYYDTSGIFIVTRIEFVMLPSGGDNINGNSNDDNSNDNDDDDDDDDNNDND
jgi:hypothetical protein